MNPSPVPPGLIRQDELETTLAQPGFAVLGAPATRTLSGCSLRDLDALRLPWADLPPDAYLKDGGRYRRRRHSCFMVQEGQVTQVPHRAHWQRVKYNALPVWLGQVCSGLRDVQPW